MMFLPITKFSADVDFIIFSSLDLFTSTLSKKLWQFPFCFEYSKYYSKLQELFCDFW